MERKKISEDRLDIRSLAMDCPSGYRTDLHAHPWHQLIYASRGVMTADTQTGSWVVPARRAVWMPATVPHRVLMHGLVSMRTLYIRDGISDSLPKECCVLNVSDLLRELILRTIEIGMLDRDESTHKHLTDLILDQLETIHTIPLKLPMPTDKRAVSVAEILREQPDSTHTLDQLAHEVGASKRTIERMFLEQTEMTFGRWRQQLRLLTALRLLAAGHSVTSVALEIGYDSPSAFIAAFKTTMGTTPGQYYAEVKR
jgi:AraC-like DNA-binding protein